MGFHMRIRLVHIISYLRNTKLYTWTPMTVLQINNGFRRTFYQLLEYGIEDMQETYKLKAILDMDPQ